jgi:protein subunit release factor B
MALLFSVKLSDLREEQYRGSGAGGQKRNKTSSAIRFTHEPSGATGESESQRSQLQNRKEALRRLSVNPTFIRWAHAQAAAIQEGYASLDRKVDDLMRPENLRIETYTPHGIT